MQAHYSYLFETKGVVMKIKIEFEDCTTAFDGNPKELVRVMKTAVEYVCRQAAIPFHGAELDRGLWLRDRNGNTVGKVEVRP